MIGTGSALPSLEVEFEPLAFPPEIDIHADCGFPDFLSPNEDCPDGMIPHMEGVEKGLFVSTGTERAFFSLCFADKARCEGIVIRDINPRVKAYNDFNTLLLRISANSEEYSLLSEINLSETGLNNRRIEILTKKISESTLPAKVANYYVNNLHNFSALYYSIWKNWRHLEAAAYSTCRYDLNKEHFSKLQAYARSGNIITTVGKINELLFLKNRTVSLVDTSNIGCYSWINVKGPAPFSPRILWTKITSPTSYFSENYEPLSEEENNRWIFCLELLNRTFPANYGRPEEYKFKQLLDNIKGYCKKIKNSNFDGIISKSMLSKINDYIKDNILEFPGLGPVDFFDCTYYSHKLHHVTQENMAVIMEHPEIHHVLPSLMESWNLLSRDNYLEICKHPRWSITFLQAWKANSHLRNGFADRFKDHKVMDYFKLLFN